MKILVINDDHAMTELLLLLLQPSSSVQAAATEKAGVQLAHEQIFDLILVDLLTQQANGWDVCRQIRQFSRVPILILSALDNPGSVAAALDAGADDYIIKPVTSGCLMAHINRLVSRGALSAAAA